MKKEDILKNAIITEYGSISKFAKENDIPDSSIRNIFNRGIEGASVGLVVKICKILQLDVESLMDDAFQLRPHPMKDAFWAEYTNSLNARDRRDIAHDLEHLMANLESGGDLMFDGDPLSEEAKESIRSAMKLGLEAAKLKNKERFTPKKYQKD